MANALKAFLTITLYFNNYYSSHKNISDSDIPYFLNQITINNKVYSMSSIANSQMEEEQLKVIAIHFSTAAFSNEGEQIFCFSAMIIYE